VVSFTHSSFTRAAKAHCGTACPDLSAKFGLDILVSYLRLIKLTLANIHIDFNHLK
jgi:hypothetical protein